MDSDINLMLHLLPVQLWNTLYMVAVAAFSASVIGIPLGVVVALTSKGHLKESPWLHEILSTVINIGRSFPFAILLVALIPFTRWLVGTSLGTLGVIVPLTIAAIPFLARQVATTVQAIRPQIVEAAVMMGSSSLQLITKVLLPEALPSLIADVTTTVVHLIGYSAMAGLVGGGGLGQVAIQYGYHRFNLPVMIVTILLLILVVQLVQWGGSMMVRTILRKRGQFHG
jgi:D-methionine transport system permease protein